MRQTEKDLLNKSKQEKNFPPKSRVEELSRLGGARVNSRWAQLVVKAYQESATNTLERFTELLSRNSARLTLSTDDHFAPILQEAIQTLFTEARALLARDIGEEWMRVVRHELSETGILESLMSLVRLRDLSLEASVSSINIQGHVANIVVGNVSHSGLSGSVSHLVNSGNITADTGRHLETLLAVVSEMSEQHQVQQRQLYDLVKGFSQQLELPSEKRSITTIQAIWEKMVQVSQVSSEVFKAIEKIAPYILPVILGRS